MSTTTAPRRAYDHDETQRRVRHPLHAVRKYIRTYVFLEGAAIALLFLFAWFWCGLLLDYGTFRLFAFDWLQELRDIAPDANNALLVRLVLLGVLFAVLAGLIITKVAMRWLREFNDRALALVLERRFPRELGDRLITAVELADTKRAKRYGYSEAMVQHTIQDAVARIDRLPVASVFNWGRLAWWWVCVAVASVGAYVVVGVATCAVGLMSGGSASPLDFAWRFHDVAMIWSERNLLVQNTYWPRRAFLEFTRFQSKRANPNEMRVPRDEKRPELVVRAVQWVIADPATPEGWRALRWGDLHDRGLVDDTLLERVAIPENWPGWTVDLDDLDPAVPSGLVPSTLQDKRAGEARALIAADPQLVKTIRQAGAEDAIERLLNWKTWTVDRIALQEEKPEVRVPLRETAGHAALQEVFEKLEELAESPHLSRTLRKLVVPRDVTATARGALSVVIEPCGKKEDTNKFSFPLDNLKESSRLRMHGEDYYTPAKYITLVAPPSVRRLSVDKEEPAYLYYRLQGGAQQPLKGQKQIFRDATVSITGELSTIDVPIGTDLVVRAEADRKLLEPVRIKAPISREPGAIVPDLSVVLGSDGQTFEVALRNVNRTLDFVFEFNDEDNVRGRRHVRIRPIDDLPPNFEGDVGLGVVLRKPRARGAEAKAVQGTAADGFLITPDALLPFAGQIRDDHGLTRVGWLFEVEPVDVELVSAGKGGKDKLPTLVLEGNAQLRRLRLIATALQYNPASYAPRLMIPAYLHWADRVLAADLKRSSSAQAETFAMMEQFEALLQAKSAEQDEKGRPLEIPMNILSERLQPPSPDDPRRPLPAWEFNLRDEPGFDVKRQLPRLKVTDATKEGQPHYMLKVSVLATDNNVEGGKPFVGVNGQAHWGNSTRSKTPFQFLVVTENELLAQVALEEESLYERLDKAYDKLKNAKTFADDQATKLAGTMRNDDMGLVSIRLDDVRKAVIDAGSSTREIYSAYANILKELKVNRVQKDRVEKVEDKIVWPLEQAVEPTKGNFVMTDALFQEAYQGVFDDTEANRGLQNQAKHLQAVKTATKELDALLERINSVLIALNQGIAESRERERLIAIERMQRQVMNSLRETEADIIRRLLEELNKGTNP